MAITKRTLLDQIEVRPNGTVQVRFVKQLVEDGKVLTSEYHRTSIVPGCDVDNQMRLVNAHLLTMEAGTVADYQALKDHVTVAHTPERIAAFRTRQS